jgi:hypothetical protein
MPGWIIQGVRGEGKSLAAVSKIREYMLRGCPVATNLNLFLEKLLPDDNGVLAYRLPDHPRLVDFQMLPPAYDPKYKGDDKNGLLVLDELGTWLNSRNWNDKNRLEMLNWLFLSRKDHWDLILLAQDFEMIDSQVRTTLCDFLVQASRLDRQKIPYLAGAMRFFGLSGFMPRVHRYHVYYGMSLQTVPVDTWSLTGRDFYDGYDTNQKFSNGQEPLCGTLVDMRATYSYLPVKYLTRRVFIDRLQAQIEQLRDLGVNHKQGEGEVMAKKGALKKEVEFFKIGLIVLALAVFLGWRYFSTGFSIPSPSTSVAPVALSQPVVPDVTPVPIPPESGAETKNATQTVNFIAYLLKNYRPRLSATLYNDVRGFSGLVEFYDHDQLVETFTIDALHALGVSILHREYGADLVYDGKAFIVTSWPTKRGQSAPLQAQLSVDPTQSKKSDSQTQSANISGIDDSDMRTVNSPASQKISSVEQFQSLY